VCRVLAIFTLCAVWWERTKRPLQLGKVPPGKFSQQFIRDLQNSDVTNLSQIKWYFEGSKSPADFAKNMEEAINKLELTDDLARKFLGIPDKEVLRTELIDNLNEIFKLK
jgi:hypothetical protein